MNYETIRNIAKTCLKTGTHIQVPAPSTYLLCKIATIDVIIAFG